MIMVETFKRFRRMTDKIDRRGTPEVRHRQSIAALGKPKTAEHRANISRGKKGKSNGPCPAERAERIARSQYRDYRLVSPSGLIYHVNTKQLRVLLEFESLNYKCMMAVRDKPRKYRGWTITCLGLSRERHVLGDYVRDSNIDSNSSNT